MFGIKVGSWFIVWDISYLFVDLVVNEICIDSVKWKWEKGEFKFFVVIIWYVC